MYAQTFHAASTFRVKMEAAWTSDRWYPTTTLHGVTTQTTSTCNIAVKASKFASEVMFT